jgi:UDP-N-acetylglucosamine 2-epimerase (hydrolysing)
MLRGELPTLAEVAERYGLGDVVGHRSGYGVCVVHPVVGDAAETADVARAALAAAARCDGPFVVLRPNSDDGHEVVAEWIQFHAGPRMRVLPSMRATHFARLLSDAAIAIGNSSAIVREAPVFGTPAISIGTRQRGRVSGGLVYQLPATPAEAVTGAAQALWGQRGPRAMAFGDGRAAERFMAVLEQPATWTRSEKVFHDIESAE